MKKRYLESEIIEDLKSKMVFIGGARQVGKTSLAKSIAEKNFNSYDYLNWDHPDDRKKIMQSRFKGDAELLLFDEIHKYRDWKNYLKGQFDKYGRERKILVTGSARLDVYRRGGDSLMGRYYYFRLHPFSLAEFLEIDNRLEPFKGIEVRPGTKETSQARDLALRFGGFPEPLLKQSEKELRRWHNQRLERLVKEDIRDIENIRELSLLQVLVDILPSKVGSLFSLNALREDLSVAHKTVANWVEILERFYYHFRIYPFNHRRIKSLRKEPKLYLYDWSQAPAGGPRVENMVASHLLKTCHYLNDAEGRKTELHFLRDIEGREVDFLVTENSEPWFAVEVKSSAGATRNLSYFGRKLEIPFLFQVTAEENVDTIHRDIRTISLDAFLASLK